MVKLQKHKKQKMCIKCDVELVKDVNWSYSRHKTGNYICKLCHSDGNIPNRLKNNNTRMFVNHKYVPKTHPLYKPGRYASFDHAAFSSLPNYTKSTEGQVYIIKNSAWLDWYKIGKAVDAEDRCNKYQTGSPFRDYELLHTFNTSNRNRAETLALRAAEKICLERRGEWFYTKNLNELIEGITP